MTTPNKGHDTILAPFLLLVVLDLALKDTIGTWGRVVLAVLAASATVAQAERDRLPASFRPFSFALQTATLASIALAFMLAPGVGHWLGFGAACVVLGILIVGPFRSTTSDQNRAS